MLHPRWTRFALAFMVVPLLCVACATSETSDDGPPVQGEELTDGQIFLNVVTFPFRMIGYGLYYSVKFVFYDIWAALFEAVFPPGDDDDLDTWIHRLDDPDPKIRATAAWRVGDADAGDEAERLVPLLRDDDPAVRGAASEALGRLRNTDVVNAVIGLLNASSPAVCAAAAHTLGLIGDERAIYALKKTLNHSEWSVRAESALALGRLRTWSVGPALIETLSDTDPRVRGAAVLGLMDTGDRRALPALRRRFLVLEKEGTFVRASLITAMGELGDASQLTRLRRIATGEGPVDDLYSRSAALWALGRMKDERSRSTLTGILKDATDPLYVLEGAARGLAEMGDQAALADAARSKEVMARLASVVGLVLLGGEYAEELLISMAKDAYADVRQRAIVALLMLGRRDAVPLLITQLTAVDLEIKSWAFLELKRISGRDLGLEPSAWLAWWEQSRKSWNLRRFYPAQGRK